MSKVSQLMGFCCIASLSFAMQHGMWTQYYQAYDDSFNMHSIVHTPYFVCYDSICASDKVLPEVSYPNSFYLSVAQSQVDFENSILQNRIYIIERSKYVID